MVSTHILEVFDCCSAEKRDSYKKDLLACGAMVSDEKVIYDQNNVKFYLILDQLNKHTEDSFIEKLKTKTTMWKNVVWLTRIIRGTDKKTNLVKKA